MLAFLVLKPPVETVANECVIESNQVSPPSLSNTISAIVIIT